MQGEETKKKVGRKPMEHPRWKNELNINFRLPKEIVKLLDDAAEKMGVSRNRYVRDVVVNFIAPREYLKYMGKWPIDITDLKKAKER